MPFVVVTNGVDIHCYNSANKKRIMWDGKNSDKIPSRSQIGEVLRILHANPQELSISISNDASLPYRQGLPLRQLNALFYKGHSTIRKIEKNEEYAFSDFSKLLFLRLLEEKGDLQSDFVLPYSYRFYELAETPAKYADRVMDAIKSMINTIVSKTVYGDVLKDELKLRNPKTFLSLVKDLASVSFCDCSIDSKGAAFEYCVRATLKGKKLGQYFTPRELVQVMLTLVGENKIANAVISGTKIKVLDPACGTGGFLVYLMQDTIGRLQERYRCREITKTTFNNAVKKVREEVFYGSDANDGVAASAKMNMIIAGDGHTNIQHEDSLSETATNWSVVAPDRNLILTNPPFGTAEGDSLSKEDMQQYSVSSTKGQYLFLQKMISCVVPGGEICTVIDEGLLNTDTGKALRNHIMQQCRLMAIINLPTETFKPNKINVRSSLLYLEKREVPDNFFEDVYLTTICCIESLGYLGSGEKIREFDTGRFLKEIRENVLNQSQGLKRSGYNWHAFDIGSTEIASDPSLRFDYKYWNGEIRKEIEHLNNKGMPKISELNTIPTHRGKSPTPDSYVDEVDGYALVVKAGSNISKYGILIVEQADWIEKSVFEEYCAKSEVEPNGSAIINVGDVLLASTGDGTLGKCCVYDREFPAVADGHVTIIRVDPSILDPYYLADYLRYGFGSHQIERLYTGATGLIELTPDQVDSIVIDLCSRQCRRKILTEAGDANIIHI